jgi:8-oxo-dGTP pyrophosphatase MutT (NUDIX family)
MAARELIEETGYSANCLQPLGWVYAKSLAALLLALPHLNRAGA